MTWTYLRSEPGLWTVGWHNDGHWEPESDHSTPQEAAERCHYLNGGCSAEDEDDAIAELREEIAQLREQLQSVPAAAANPAVTSRQLTDPEHPLDPPADDPYWCDAVGHMTPLEPIADRWSQCRRCGEKFLSDRPKPAPAAVVDPAGDQTGGTA